MTKLAKSVTREVEFNGVKRPVLVTMDPNKTFRFREKGTRREFVFPMYAVMVNAILDREK
jgi:hypothetical protein